MRRLNSFCLVVTVILILCYEVGNVGALIDEQKEDAGVGESCTSICSSSKCANVAKNLIENMDQTIDPCDDFYQFVCGNYEKEYVLEKNQNSISQIDAAQNRTNEQLIHALNSEILPTDIEAFKKMKIFFKNCLDEDEIEKVGLEPLLNLLNRLGGWPVLLGDEWKEENYKLEDLITSISKEGFDLDFPMSLFLRVDGTNNLAITLYSNYGYMKNTENQSTEAYRSYLVDVAVLLGADRERANAEMEDMIEFEQKLYRTRNPIYRPSRKSINDMSKEFSDLPWLDIINAILSSRNITVTGSEFAAYDPKWISDLGSLIKTTPKRVVANYQIYQLVDRLMLFLPEKLRNRTLLFYSTPFSSRKVPRREDTCLDVVKRGFDIAIASLYIKNYFNQQPQNKINELIENIREETKASLEKLDWMDNHTRKGALEKLEYMEILVAYPDELNDDEKVDELYDNLEIVVGKLFDNVQKTYAHARNNNKNKMFTQESGRIEGWVYDVFGVTRPYASYNPVENQIRIYAGILQEPFFNSQWPDYLNYGGIGHLIGHEISHGFDDRGRHYDYKGSAKGWWNRRTTANFVKKVRCKIEEYNNYTMKQIDGKINGKLTALENVADAAGIKIAYNAYKKSIASKGAKVECLPNLNYSSEKLFWINAATIHCRKMTDEYLKQALVRDFRSPPEARVNVAFSDNENFAKDFECPLGSKMNPEKKCIVW